MNKSEVRTLEGDLGAQATIGNGQYVVTANVLCASNFVISNILDGESRAQGAPGICPSGRRSLGIVDLKSAPATPHPPPCERPLLRIPRGKSVPESLPPPANIYLRIRARSRSINSCSCEWGSGSGRPAGRNVCDAGAWALPYWHIASY